MTDEQLHAYFEQIATELPEIAHRPEQPRFGAMSVDEVLSNQRQATASLRLNNFCLILQDYEGAYRDQRSDLTLDYMMCTLWIVKNGRTDDYAQHRRIRSEARQILEKVVGRLRHDFTERIIPGFDLNSVRYDSVGPIWDGAHGKLLEFTLYGRAPIAYNPNDWNR